jgi:Cys-rich protein (TIGR01571 family)
MSAVSFSCQHGECSQPAQSSCGSCRKNLCTAHVIKGAGDNEVACPSCKHEDNPSLLPSTGPAISSPPAQYRYAMNDTNPNQNGTAQPQPSNQILSPPPPPPIYYVPNASYGYSNVIALDKEWTQTLCGCCNDWETCLCAFCCPCVVYGRNVRDSTSQSCCAAASLCCCAELGLLCAVPRLGSIFGGMTRTTIRKNNGIKVFTFLWFNKSHKDGNDRRFSFLCTCICVFLKLWLGRFVLRLLYPLLVSLLRARTGISRDSIPSISQATTTGSCRFNYGAAASKHSTGICVGAVLPTSRAH